MLAIADLLLSIYHSAVYLFIIFDRSIENSKLLNRMSFSWLTVLILSHYLQLSLDSFCVFLTVVFSIDRLYAVIKPVHIESFFIHRHPKRIALVGYLVVLTILIIKFYFKIDLKLEYIKSR